MLIPSTDIGCGEPTFVFLHHFGGSARQWRGVVDNLAPEHRCISADMPGFGRAASLTGFTVEEMLSQLDGLVQAKSLSRFVLVGHSMTAKVALAFATRRPETLLGLVLVTPSPPGPEPIDDRQELLRDHGSRLGAEQLINKITARQLPPELYQLAVEDNLLASPEAWSAWLNHGSYEDWTERINTESIPVLVVTGHNDPALPADIQKKLTLPYLKNVRLVDLPECGHLPPLEAAPKLSSLLREFANVGFTASNYRVPHLNV